ncbi:MAG: NUDIX hydrolase [Chloroflexi bacterium]|nr:NUDIX hydrolase [Chloroflexota bacterium]
MSTADQALPTYGPGWDDSLPHSCHTVHGPDSWGVFWQRSRRDRAAEVVLCVQRTNGKLLVHTKSFYPPSSWRLLSGGVHHNEPPGAAALREGFEETSLELELVRALARLDYRFIWPSGELIFTSFLYLMREIGGELAVADAGEQITGYREVEVAELPALADALDALPSEDWNAWGRFRALAHRAAWQLLSAPDA